MHECLKPGECDISAVNGVIHDEVKRLWLEVRPKHVEHYTVPLYRLTERAQPSSDSPASGGTGQSEKDSSSVSTLQARITELEEALTKMLIAYAGQVTNNGSYGAEIDAARAALKEPT
jgi:hypothetical protein